MKSIIILIIIFIGVISIDGQEGTIRDDIDTSTVATGFLTTSIPPVANHWNLDIHPTNAFIGGQEIIIMGCYCTVQSNCYRVNINDNSSFISVGHGSRYISTKNCHNIIINTGCDLTIENVSNRIYWQEPKDTIYIGSVPIITGGWKWEPILPIPVPICR